ncbi:hypothetical protein AVEN_215762-1 [Araneus ventricosus]|uniref:Uncharacterized protein n=1 Tax=Araneus ventricosus TaxID=182803 RepID=A0A4Y2JRD9_ARAVE|nr:hypothetical protein AVEN_215762-1 [Araneus ventricosus]
MVLDTCFRPFIGLDIYLDYNIIYYKYQAVVHSSIQTNAYFGLPENVFLAIMTDFQLAVRQDALNKILNARQDEVENVHHSIRYNIIPQLNFEAENHTDMILWESPDVSITVPPVLRNASNEELIVKLSLPDNTVPEWFFIACPCHTVADRLYFLGKLCLNFNLNPNY